MTDILNIPRPLSDESTDLNVMKMVCYNKSNEYFEIDQSNLNDPVFNLHLYGNTERIRTEDITFVLFDYEILYSMFVNDRDPPLYYSVQFQNKPTK